MFFGWENCVECALLINYSSEKAMLVRGSRSYLIIRVFFLFYFGRTSGTLALAGEIDFFEFIIPQGYCEHHDITRL